MILKQLERLFLIHAIFQKELLFGVNKTLLLNLEEFYGMKNCS